MTNRERARELLDRLGFRGIGPEYVTMAEQANEAPLDAIERHLGYVKESLGKMDRDTPTHRAVGHLWYALEAARKVLSESRPQPSAPERPVEKCICDWGEPVTPRCPVHGSGSAARESLNPPPTSSQICPNCGDRCDPTSFNWRNVGSERLPRWQHIHLGRWCDAKSESDPSATSERTHGEARQATEGSKGAGNEAARIMGDGIRSPAVSGGGREVQEPEPVGVDVGCTVSRSVRVAQSEVARPSSGGVPEPLPEVLPNGTRTSLGDASGLRLGLDGIYSGPTSAFCRPEAIRWDTYWAALASLPNPPPATTQIRMTLYRHPEDGQLLYAPHGTFPDECIVPERATAHTLQCDARSNRDCECEPVTGIDGTGGQQAGREPSDAEWASLSDCVEAHLGESVRTRAREAIRKIRAGRASLAKRNALLEAFVDWLDRSMVRPGDPWRSSLLERIADLKRELSAGGTKGT